MPVISAIPYGGGGGTPAIDLTPLWEGQAAPGQIIPLTNADDYDILLAAFDDLGMTILRKHNTNHSYIGSILYADTATTGQISVVAYLTSGASGITVTRVTYLVHYPNAGHSAQLVWGSGITGIYTLTASRAG